MKRFHQLLFGLMLVLSLAALAGAETPNPCGQKAASGAVNPYGEKAETGNTGNPCAMKSMDSK